MRLRNLLYLLLALPLFAVGCNNDSDGHGALLSSTMKSDTLKFGTQGGVGIITYSLTNAPRGATVEATCEADWITNLTVDSNILFSVLPNEDGDRSTEIVVSYKEQSFKVTIEQRAQAYVYDITFTSASRLPLVGIYPDNCILVEMSDEATNATLDVMFVCAQNEHILVAGEYNDTIGNILAYFNTFYIDDERINFENYLNYIVVEGDINNYSIDAKFIDADNNQYRFRFNGVIDEMGENINHIPEEDVTMVATEILGTYYEQKYSNTYNYSIDITDTGFSETGDYLKGGRYYTIDLYGIEPVIDEEGYLTIPAGTYTANPNYYDEDWSICTDYSAYTVVNTDFATYYTYCPFDTATVTVTENSLHMEATTGDVKHTATYNGPVKFYVGVAEKMEGQEFVADLLYILDMGTTEAGTHNYYVMVSDIGFDSVTGKSLPGSTFYCFDLYSVAPESNVEGSRTVPYGTYTLDERNSCAEWTIGKRNTDYTITSDDGSDYDVYELFDELTVVISESGINATGVIKGGTHTITYNGAPKF